MEKTISEYDCSDVMVKTESINNLNTYFQINNLPDLEFEHQQLGQSHNPIFHTTVFYEACLFSAKSKTKKDCEKKIKTYLYHLISEGILSNEEKIRKLVKTEEPKSSPFYNFENFKETLKELVDPSKSMLILDLENCGNKVLNNPQFKEICKTNQIGLLCVTTRYVPENQGEILVFKRENMHKDSADEGIRRIIYYLIDNLNLRMVGLITMDHFGQHLKDIFVETHEKFILFKDLEDFISKHSQLVKDIVLEKEKESFTEDAYHNSMNQENGSREMKVEVETQLPEKNFNIQS